jgi:uncharacterized membrane protein (UPF0182 family)
MGGINPHAITWGELISLVLILVFSTIVVDGVFFGGIDWYMLKKLCITNGLDCVAHPSGFTKAMVIKSGVRFIMLAMVIVAFMVGLESSPTWKKAFTFGSAISPR